MAKRTFQIVAIVAAAALVGMLSLTVVATGGGSEEDQEGGWLHHLHQLGHHLHHGGHHQDHVAQLIEQLELTPDQHQHLEKIHEILGGFGSDGHGSMAELHNQLVSQFEQGYLDADEIHRAIDGHLEQIRGMAYAVADELTELVNGLDAAQRETLLAHLREMDLEGHDPGH